MNEDFLDILRALLDEGARFLVAGAHALAVHGVPRATGDLDIWIDRETANGERVWRALISFGAPVESLDLSIDDSASRASSSRSGSPPGESTFSLISRELIFKTPGPIESFTPWRASTCCSWDADLSSKTSAPRAV